LNYVELVGYAGSLLVAASLTMSNIWKLRWINLLGAVIFSIYSVWIGAYPVFAVNSFIACVDIYYILQLSRRKDFFSYIEPQSIDDALLRKFLEFYDKDIKNFFPSFELESLRDPHFLIILRNLIPVGLFVYEPKEDGMVEIEVDYVIPDYRDLKNASFVYSEKASQLYKLGFNQFVTRSSVLEHQQYLRKVGYIQDNNEKDLFKKEISSEKEAGMVSA
jgi:3-phenylpropionate/cinnamic acid dioxygenase small subunit